MGCSAASTLFLLTLLVGMVKEHGKAAALTGKGSPDFEGYEKLLKNISGSRIPGMMILNDHGESVSISAFKIPHAIFR